MTNNFRGLGKPLNINTFQKYFAQGVFVAIETGKRL